jgi:hypothetical protein
MNYPKFTKIIHYTQFIYLVLFGLIFIFSLLLTYLIVEQITIENAFKPDFKVSYWSNYNKTECEINIGTHLNRSDLYDFCIYQIQEMRGEE